MGCNAACRDKAIVSVASWICRRVSAEPLGVQGIFLVSRLWKLRRTSLHIFKGYIILLATYTLNISFHLSKNRIYI